MLNNFPNRRGAVLIVALVLLTVLGIVAGTMLPQILRDRQESRRDLLRTQARQLLDDALRGAEAKRKSDSAFSGETLTLGRDIQPFSGTFRVTTRLENNAFIAEVEYRDKEEKVVFIVRR
jgi:Tfp pilus assembly protein PilX